MTVLAATDLDGTLIFSRRAAGGDVTGLRAVEHVDGVATAFLTPGAWAELHALTRHAVWVPATTRTVAQYTRLALPGCSYAVCANGGVLLVDGCPDPDWSAHVADVVAAAAPGVEIEEGMRRLGLDPRDADGLFRYAHLDRALPDGFADWCASVGWRAVVAGRKLYGLPAGLTKAAAVAEVARRVGATRLLAAGDSPLDTDLLELADHALRPAHGAVSCGEVTASRGVAAGEEIVSRLVARAGIRSGDALG